MPAHHPEELKNNMWQLSSKTSKRGVRGSNSAISLNTDRNQKFSLKRYKNHQTFICYVTKGQETCWRKDTYLTWLLADIYFRFSSVKFSPACAPPPLQATREASVSRGRGVAAWSGIFQPSTLFRPTGGALYFSKVQCLWSDDRHIYKISENVAETVSFNWRATMIVTSLLITQKNLKSGASL